MPAIRAICVAASAGLLLACDLNVGDKGVSVGVSAGRAKDTWTRTYTLPAGGRLDAVNVNGPIVVTLARDGRVEIQVEREAQAMTDEGARERLAETEVVESAAPDRVSVKVQGRGGRGRRREGPGGLSSNMTVKLPPGLVASFSTENGRIRLEQVEGRLAVSTANGGIETAGVAGGLTATAVNGPVQVSMRAVTAPVELTVVNGQIRLEIPSTTKARVVASALNGGITVDDSLKLEADGSGETGFPQRRLEGVLNGGGPQISAQATNGGIRISAEGSPRK
jgi:hypothetical protein